MWAGILTPHYDSCCARHPFYMSSGKPAIDTGNTAYWSTQVVRPEIIILAVGVLSVPQCWQCLGLILKADVCMVLQWERWRRIAPSSRALRGWC